jgi:hypothetical protein
MGVCLQILDSVIRDWLEPPPAPPLRAPSQSKRQWNYRGSLEIEDFTERWSASPFGPGI